MRDSSERMVREFLARHPKDKRILIAAATDTSALGAIEALRALRRESHAAVAGQDCLEEMLAEMARPGSPAIGSVSHEVREYGPQLIDLGLALLRGDKVPPYNYVEHKLRTSLDLTAQAVGLSDASPAPSRGAEPAASGRRSRASTRTSAAAR